MKRACVSFLILQVFLYLGCESFFLEIPKGKDYLQAERSGFILQDDEPWEVYVDPNLRSFDIRSPLVVSVNHESQYDENPTKKQKAISSDEFRITSYLLQPVKNVQVWVTFRGIPSPLLLLEIEEFPALAQQFYKIPIIYQAGTYRTRDGQWIDVPQMDDLDNSMLSFEITSEDEFFQKFSTLRTAWKIQFLEKDGISDLNWVKMTPLDCREWLTVVSNLAYTWSSPEFDLLLDHYDTIVADSKNSSESHHFIRTPQKEGARAIFYATDVKKIGQRDLNGELISADRVKADKKKLCQSLFIDREDDEVKTLALGVVSGRDNVVGLGGGMVFGIAYYHLFLHYREACATAVHEIGHCLDYEHGSSMCYGSMEDYLPNLTMMFMRTKQAPYSDRDIVGYYSEKYDFLYPNLDRNYLRNTFGGVRSDEHFNHFERFAKSCPQFFSQKTLTLLEPWLNNPKCTKIEALEKAFR